MNVFSKILQQFSETALVDVPIDLITNDPAQPRRNFSAKRIDDLAADIAINGVLQPIRIRAVEEEQRFSIVVGERRWRAAEHAGLAHLPALLDEVAESSPLDRAMRQLAENYHREQLRPMDLAVFLARLKTEHQLSVKSISTLLKERGFREMGRSYVSNTIRLTTLPERYQDAIQDGDLAPTTGQYLLQVKSLLPAQSELIFAAFDRALVEQASERDSDDPWEITALECRDTLIQQIATAAIPIRQHARIPSSWEDDCGAGWVEFDPLTCIGCPSFKKWTVDGMPRMWCVNPSGFRAKQSSAFEAKANSAPQAPEKLSVDDEGRVELQGVDEGISPEEGGSPDGFIWTESDPIDLVIDSANRARAIKRLVLEVARMALVKAIDTPCPFSGPSSGSALLRWLASGAGVRDRFGDGVVSDLYDLAPPLDVDDLLPEQALLDEERAQRATTPSDLVQLLGTDSIWSWVVALGLHECTITEADVADIDPEFSDLVLEEVYAAWNTEVQTWRALRKPQQSSSEADETAAATVSP